jgi:hypothetical protein
MWFTSTYRMIVHEALFHEALFQVRKSLVANR